MREAQGKVGLSYHYFIRRDGTVDQMYPDREPLWHACHWSHRSIAIAVHGDFVPEDGSRFGTPTEQQLEAAVRLVGRLVEAYSSPRHTPWIAGHTELKGASKDPDKHCPGRNFPMNWLRERVAQGRDQLKGTGTVSLLTPPAGPSYRARG